MKYLVANWKANKNLNQAELWTEEFNQLIKSNKKVLAELEKNKLTIIICPAFHLIYPVKQKLIKLPNIFLGAQDVSFFERGSYTGEVSASALIGLVDYAIIGHSERRRYFKENNATIDQKTVLAMDNDIEPILCIRDNHDLIPNKVKLVAYEPIYAIGHAIGTGGNEPVNKVLQMKQSLHLDSDVKFLYGGSANENNASSYIKTGQIDGFLIGTASKDPVSFYNTIVASL